MDSIAEVAAVLDARLGATAAFSPDEIVAIRNMLSRAEVRLRELEQDEDLETWMAAKEGLSEVRRTLVGEVACEPVVALIDLALKGAGSVEFQGIAWEILRLLQDRRRA
jgi:hypothetical protein